MFYENDDITVGFNNVAKKDTIDESLGNIILMTHCDYLTCELKVFQRI